MSTTITAIPDYSDWRAVLPLRTVLELVRENGGPVEILTGYVQTYAEAPDHISWLAVYRKPGDETVYRRTFDMTDREKEWARDA